MTVYPFVIHFGRFMITGYGLMMMLGFALAGWIYARELARIGQPTNIAWDTVVFAVIGGLLGSKIYYALAAGRWDALFSRGGLVWYGGLIGGTAAVFGYLWWRRLDAPPLLDAISPSLAVGYLLGRVGCFLVNDDWGLPTSLPWAMAFPKGSPPSTARVLSGEYGVALGPDVIPDEVLAVHPTQLYEIALMFVVFWLLWRVRERRHAAGWLFGLYLALSSIERIVVETVRAKDDRILGPVTVAQLMSVGLVALGLWIMRARTAPAGAPAR